MKSLERGIRIGIAGGVVATMLHADGNLKPVPTVLSPDTTLVLAQRPVDYGSLLVDTQSLAKTPHLGEWQSFSTASAEIASTQKLALVVTPGIGNQDPTQHPFFSAINEEIHDPTHPLNMAVYPVLPDNPNDPEANAYVKKIQQRIEEAGKRNEKVVLLGYSHGARAMVLLLNSLVDKDDKNFRPDLAPHIVRVILLAPRNNDMDNWKKRDQKIYPNYAGFYATDLSSSKPESKISRENLQQIKLRFGKLIIVITGKDDPVVSVLQSEQSAVELGGYLIERDELGKHFGTKQSGEIVAQTLVLVYKAWKCTEDMKDFVKKPGVSKVDLTRKQAQKSPTPDKEKYGKFYRNLSREGVVVIFKENIGKSKNSISESMIAA